MATHPKSNAPMSAWKNDRKSYVNDLFDTDRETFIRRVILIFMKDGNPTETYQQFLLDMAEYAPWASDARKQQMIDVLMSCEEGVYGLINGIIPVETTHPQYFPYLVPLEAIYDHDDNRRDASHISNTSVVHMIQALQSKCTNKHCHRNNSLHKRWMH